MDSEESRYAVGVGVALRIGGILRVPLRSPESALAQYLACQKKCISACSPSGPDRPPDRGRSPARLASPCAPALFRLWRDRLSELTYARWHEYPVIAGDLAHFA